jgi:Bacterial Ig-like domain (group 3)/FG-GAP-like repeat/FG-GAP repeat
MRSATYGAGLRSESHAVTIFVVLMAMCGHAALAGATNPTTTTLAVKLAGNTVTTAAAGSVVTLLATVTLAGSPVTPGQVNFCDATANDCLGIHLLGSAQLITGGTASMSFVPGIGIHSYQAVFLADTGGAGSQSSAQPLKITGSYLTTTTITSSGTLGNYTLTAAILGESNLPVPIAGTVSFLDMSDSSGLLGMAALTPGTASLVLTAALTQVTGKIPVNVVTADFNGDGHDDVAVLNYADSSITVLLGNGDGTFNAAPVTYTGSGPAGLVVGDWNGDGKPDLATTNDAVDTVSVLLGNGDGTFTATVASPATGLAPSGLATGDFNGDGNADLAVSNYGADTVTILLGHGDGSFSAAAVNPATGHSPSDITIADFNGDGKADAAVTNFSGQTVTILLGNGDGTFTASTAPAGSEPYLLVSGDFNGDGKPDLAISNYLSASLSILLGNGDGTFTAAPSPATGTRPFAMAIADLNQDGKTDIAVANYASNHLTLLLGNGDGTFTASSTVPVTGNEPIAIAAADLNGDGTPDLMVPSYTANTMSVWLTQLQQSAQAVLTHAAPLGTGTHNVEASYPATTPYAASQSATTSLAAAIGGSVLTLSANPPSGSNFGDQVVLTATLGPSAPEGLTTNGETVTFYNGSSSLGTGVLTGGVATLTLTSLPIETDNLTAVYSGDANLATSTSPALAFPVANNALTLVLSGGTATETIASNGTATFAFLLTPGSSTAFGANVSITVAGGPAGATSTFNPASITAGSGATTVTLTMTMPATAAVQQHAEAARRLGQMALGILLLPFVGRLRRSGRRRTALVYLLLIPAGVGAVSGLIGCGGPNTPVATTTAAQSYTVTVTAMSGSVSKSTTVGITVNGS